MDDIKISALYEQQKITARTCNCLIRAGIDTIDKLIKMSKDDLMQIRYLGKHSLDECVDLIDKYTKEETNTLHWIPISEKMPPLGICIIASVFNHLNDKNEIRYPVFYMEKVYEKGYCFYFGDTDNPLLPNVSEVTAWMPTPAPYGYKNGDDVVNRRARGDTR